MNSLIRYPAEKTLQALGLYYIFTTQKAAESFQYQTFPATNLYLSIYKTNTVVKQVSRTQNNCFVQAGGKMQSRLWGFHKKPFDVVIDGEMDQVCVIFQAGGLRKFTRIPYEELMEETDVLGAMFGRTGHDLAERLFSADRLANRLLLLDQFLLNALHDKHRQQHLDHFLVALSISHLHAPIKESMRQQAYAEWMAVVKEHLTEAVACRLAAQKFGEAFAEQNVVRVKKGRRWIYLNPLLDALKEYEANRAKYPTLEDFMPRIVESFQKITQADIDQWMAVTEAIRKPDIGKMPQIADVFDKDSVLTILSAHEGDTAADRRLKEFMSGFIKMIPSLTKGKTITDDEALHYDLSLYNLFIVGTPAGNSVLQKVLPQLPIQLNENGVIGEKKYDGKGYVLMSGWVNPHNTKKVMTVITALHPDDMLNFNRAPFGGSNYHILKDLVTYKVGEYKRNGLIWVCE